MKEDFLHHIWLHKRIDVNQLYTTKGEKIEILQFGQYLQATGPDFFNAQLIIANQKWAGNIEIHVKSSDWYLHHHETDANYDNVILHVVWEYDSPIFRPDNTEIATLELKKYVAPKELENYNNLISEKNWIYCENQFGTIDSFLLENWKERLYFERLEQKTIYILQLLENYNNDWEAVCFILLAKSFGLNINGEAFAKLAESIPFTVIRKEQSDLIALEALFFGRSGFLSENNQDTYFLKLQTKWLYLQHKYNLKEELALGIQFYKLRPDNFPTIRLSQLAMLYRLRVNLFTQLLEKRNVKGFYELLMIQSSEYWQAHYTFDAKTVNQPKKLTKTFIDLILVNSVIPLLYVYNKLHSNSESDFILDLLREIKVEKNAVVDKFKVIGCKVDSVVDSQALLHLKREYCDKKQCLKCAIGVSILKN